MKIKTVFAFVPAMVIHGSRDGTVNPVNADQMVQQFMVMSRLADGGNTAFTEFTRNQSGGDRYPYETHDYRRDDTLLLRKVLVEGLDHSWGGNGKHAFNDPKGPDASRMIWEFFAGFQRSKRKAAAAVVAE